MRKEWKYKRNSKYERYKSIEDCPIDDRANFLYYLARKMIEGYGETKDFQMWFKFVG